MRKERWKDSELRIRMARMMEEKDKREKEEETNK